MFDKQDMADLETIIRNLLHVIGEDPDREGLKETPRRVAAFWREFIDYDPGNMDTTFETVATDQMIVVKGVRVWSLCEHHLLPFYCDVAMAYITRDNILGLSKFARIAQMLAHRLQVQERLVQQIADEIATLTKSPDVAVLAKGEHLCMTMRGVRTPGNMITSNLRGRFKDDPKARAEFLSLIGAQ